MSVFDQFRLDGKRALVTGGSRGLGRSMAQAFAEAGADLVLVGRDEGSLGKARDELAALGRKVDAVPADVGSAEAADALCTTVLARYGPVDVLVNNVGGRRENVATEAMPLETWERLIDLNLHSA